MRRELVIGRVRTAHGVQGELKVESMSGETGHFERLKEVTIVRPGQADREDRRTFRVESVRTAGRVVLLKLFGIDTPEQAKDLRHWEVVADRSEAAPCAEGEYYYADLIDLRVLVDGSHVGWVRTIWEGGPGVLLGVTLLDDSTRLVPFQERFVASVDLERGLVELRDREVLS